MKLLHYALSAGCSIRQQQQAVSAQENSCDETIEHDGADTADDNQANKQCRHQHKRQELHANLHAHRALPWSRSCRIPARTNYECVENKNFYVDH